MAINFQVCITSLSNVSIVKFAVEKEKCFKNLLQLEQQIITDLGRKMIFLEDSSARI